MRRSLVRSVSRFGLLLAAITLVALTVRVGYVVVVLWDAPLKGDQVYYNAQANRLAQGEGFVEPFDRDLNVRRTGIGPSAEHPPLTALVLAPVSWVTDRLPWVDVNSTRGDIHGPAQRLTLAIIGSLGIVLIGLLGREVGGERVGLIAAGIAAVYPNLWVNDGLIMAESLTVIMVVWALYLVYRYRRAPRLRTMVLLGAACGLAAMARAEMILLFPLLVGGALLGSGASWSVLARHLAIGLAATGVVVGPWVVFNLVRFEDPTFLSTNDGQTLLGSNCDPAYVGPAAGLWHLSCLPEVPGDRSEVSTEYKRLAFTYIGDHIGEVPGVVAIRVGRLWNVYQPADMVWYNEGEGRERWLSTLGLWTFYPVMMFGAGGVFRLRRSWGRLWPLLVPIAIVTLVGALSYGQARFRAPAEPGIVVLAAVAVSGIVDWRRRESTGSLGPGDPVEPDLSPAFDQSVLLPRLVGLVGLAEGPAGAVA